MAFTLHPTIIFTILDCKETIIQEAIYVGCIPFHWCSFNRFSLCLSGKKIKKLQFMKIGNDGFSGATAYMVLHYQHQQLKGET